MLSPRNALISLALTTGLLLNLPAPAHAVGVVSEISVEPMSAIEGTGGNSTFLVPVRLSVADPIAPVTVDWRSQPISAKAAEDFIVGSGTLTFLPGDTEELIAVEVVGDDRHEFNDTFRIYLSNATNGTIKRASADSMIMDDDEPPVMTIDDVAVIEGADGSALAVLTVTVDRISDLSCSAQYTTSAGTAVPGEDYTERQSWVNLPPGTKSASFSIPIAGDDVVESDETFSVGLAYPFRATFGRGAATVTIVNDDVAPNLVTTLAFLPTTPAAGDHTDDATVEAALTSADGRALSGLPVTLQLGPAEQTVTSDSNGIARATFTLSQAPGTYERRAIFAGADGFEPSEAAGSFDVRREQASATLTATTTKTSRTLYSSLSDADAPRGPVAGRAVTFLANGVAIATRTTGVDGQAVLVLTDKYRKGAYTFEVRFAGDGSFLPATARTTTI